MVNETCSFTYCEGQRPTSGLTVVQKTFMVSISCKSRKGATWVPGMVQIWLPGYSWSQKSLDQIPIPQWHLQLPSKQAVLSSYDVPWASFESQTKTSLLKNRFPFTVFCVFKPLSWTWVPSSELLPRLAKLGTIWFPCLRTEMSTFSNLLASVSLLLERGWGTQNVDFLDKQLL